MIFKGKNFVIEIWKDIELSQTEDIEFYLHFNNNIYFGWAFTISAISLIMNKDKVSGECANGSFFWATDMIIVDEITEKCLLNTISYLI